MWLWPNPMSRQHQWLRQSCQAYWLRCDAVVQSSWGYTGVFNLYRRDWHVGFGVYYRRVVSEQTAFSRFYHRKPARENNWGSRVTDKGRHCFNGVGWKTCIKALCWSWEYKMQIIWEAFPNNSWSASESNEKTPHLQPTQAFICIRGIKPSLYLRFP